MASAFVDIEEGFEASNASMTEGLLNDEEDESSSPQKEGWAKVETFFDVDTSDIRTNLLLSIWPKPGYNLVSSDLYGPFWISMTLIFSTSLAADPRYDFDGISMASGFYFPYLLLAPLAIYGALYLKQLPSQKNIPQLISIYGYTLIPLLPITLLLVLPIPSTGRTILILLGCIWSTASLGIFLWPQLPAPLKHLTVALHFAILFIFLYFFTKTPFPSPSITEAHLPSAGPAAINETHAA
eukprot:TRINITY_DN2673_c0_g1_i3.p1 TRINITY_DN2673_c0_g1~~TRINITY_DN2673_c0_g1_i3.p1  ORF type:complete len:240 (-),score=94.43 TRINITY_DN2673_c0_g1_i3:888-1607(-)